jgi:tryptophan synthase alpha chain
MTTSTSDPATNEPATNEPGTGEPAAIGPVTARRYERAFAAAAEEGRHVTVPFFVVGDPDPERFLSIVDAAIEVGADALELGIPFSDPVADGPAVQSAVTRALTAGVDKSTAIDLLAEVRRRHPDIPIGLLVYANLVFTPSPETFFRRVAEAGVDSVLTADVPVQGIEPFRSAATAHGVQTVLIAPSNATEEDLAQIAALSSGYVYVVSRSGVTGTETAAGMPSADVLAALRAAGAPPTLLGFGISRSEHVRSAIEAGVDGVISGSAFSTLIGANLDDHEALLNAVRDLMRQLRLVAALD